MPKKPTEGAAGGPSGGLLGKDDDLRTKIRFLEDEIIKLKKNYQEKLADQVRLSLSYLKCKLAT